MLSSSTRIEATRIAILALMSAAANVGCSGGGPDPAPARPSAAVSPITPPPVSPTPVPAPPATSPVTPSVPGPPRLPAITHGHFRGTATRGDDVVHTEILITADGFFRLYLGAADPEDNVDHGGLIIPWLLEPADPMQASGYVELEDEHASGTGTIVGENCSVAAGRPLCTATADVELDLRTYHGLVNGVTGELRSGAPSSATWEISAQEWYYYRLPAPPGFMAGNVIDELSELGRLEKMRLVIDTADRVFFQSTVTGCIGNGTLAPHADGQYMVYDASISIDGCAGSFERLNGTYGGLAKWTSDSKWYIGDELLMYLSTVDAASPPRALTMYGAYEYHEYPQ